MNKLRRLIVAAALGVFATSGLPSVSQAQSDDRPDLRIAVPKLPRGLEAGRGGNVDVRVIHSVYDMLIRRDFVAEAETGALANQPGLALSVTALSEAEYEIKLRENVLWHDGTELTSADVAFSFGQERVYGDGAPARAVAATTGPIDNIEVVDRYTVRITMAGPDPIFEHRLSNKGAWIVQKAAYMAFEDTSVPTSEWMADAVQHLNWEPVGTGPYKFDEFRAGEYIKLVSHDDYFMGAPAAKSITYVEVPEASARIAGLIGGEFDIVADIPPDQVQIFDRYDNVKTADVVLDNTHVLVFNTTHPVLQSRDLREALSLAIDREALINALWAGKTFTPQGPQLETFGDMFLEDAPAFAYDPERARELIAQAGYAGEEIGFRFIPGYYQLGIETSQALQEMWRQVGLNVAIESVENWKAVRADDPAIYPWSNTYRFPDPLGQLALAYGPRSAIQTKYGFWAPGDEFNDAASRLEVTTDLEARRADFQELMDIWLEEVPATFLYNPVSTYAMREGVEFTPTSQFFDDLRPDNLRLTE